MSTSVSSHHQQLLDVRELATILNCSSRHIYRMTDAGRMPRPVRLGVLIRWKKAEIDAWLAAGCPPARCTPKVGQ